MTIDDGSSIYVGGLPYSATERSLRRIFDVYGSVVAVKIINDRAVGGRCYGFITFTNPRSAMRAIQEMDGKTIDGRVVKVNEVKTRGERSNLNNGDRRHDVERYAGGDRGRDRERDHNYERHHDQDANRGKSRDHEHDRKKEYDITHGTDRTREQYVHRDTLRDHRRHGDDIDKELEINGDLLWERDLDNDIEDRGNNNQYQSERKDEFELLRIQNSMNRELSIELPGGDRKRQVDIKLVISNQKLEQLHKEVGQMEELAADKREEVAKLHEQFQKLDESLIAARKLTSHRHTQLAEVHKCHLQLRDYSQRLTSAEQEFQALVDSTMVELEHNDREDASVRIPIN